MTSNGFIFTCQTARSFRCKFPVHIFTGRICGRKTGSHFSCKCSFTGRICGRKTGSHFSCKCSEHKAPPALLTTVRGQALNLLVSFSSSPTRGCSPRRGMERRDGAVTRDMHRHVPHAGRGVRTLSGECTPPGAPPRRCFPSRAARLGVHVRLAPTRACERIANRSYAGGRIPGTPGSLSCVASSPQAPQSPLRRRTISGNDDAPQVEREWAAFSAPAANKGRRCRAEPRKNFPRAIHKNARIDLTAEFLQTPSFRATRA